jgi:hypothetical protein
MSEVLTKEKLLEARGLIELGWTTGQPSDIRYDSNTGDDVVCYCLGGAIAEVLFGDAYRMYDPDVQGFFEEFVGLADIPIKMLGDFDSDEKYDATLGEPDWLGSVYGFNDGSSKENVLTAIDKAVSRIGQD